MKLLSNIAVILLLMVVAIPVCVAETYAHFTATQVELKSDIAKAKPYVAAVKLGYRFSETLSLEAQFGTSASDDDFNGGKVEVDKLAAVFLRMGGQSSYNGVRLYLLLGASKTEVKYSDVAVEGEGTLEGMAWGIGAEEFSKSVKNLGYLLEYIQYSDEDDTKVTGISLGLRYNF